MVPEMVFLADCGYTVAIVYYRTSDQGKFPTQVVDIKTAIRFLRANAEKYHIDPDRIGIFGRSAGGMKVPPFPSSFRIRQWCWNNVTGM